MSKKDLKKFCGLVLADLKLQEQLKTVTEREEFIAFVRKLGAQSGLEILREDIEHQIYENRRLWRERWL